MAGAARGAADVERGAVGVEAAAGAKIDFIEDALGIFPFGLAVCFKFEGRDRGNGGASGKIECVPKTIADGGGDVLKSPSFGLLRRSADLVWRCMVRPHITKRLFNRRRRGWRFIRRCLLGWRRSGVCDNRIENSPTGIPDAAFSILSTR